MRSYTVHRRRRTIGQPLAEAEATVFVRDGFSWIALLVPVLWALYHRLWLVLVGFVAVLVGVNAALASLDSAGAANLVVTAALHFLFAAEARDLRRWTLARRGYDIVAIVLARSFGEAELAYFRQWHAVITDHHRQYEVGDGVEIAFRAGPDKPSGEPQVGLMPAADLDPA